MERGWINEKYRRFESIMHLALVTKEKLKTILTMI